MFSDLHFLRPLWLLAIPAGALLLLWLAWRSRHAVGAWVSVVDAALQPYVLGTPSATSRSPWPWVLGLLIISVGACALAGPAWERQSVSLSRSADAMIIALDLSRSMDATDVAPSRLQRARLKLLDILRTRRGGETGLVVFSANAFVVTPLTTDIATIEALVPSLDTSLMPSRGSYPDSALEKAVQLFDQSDIQAGRILLITDGGNLAPAMTAMTDIRQAGHAVSVLAVGTADGGPIPQARGGFLTDQSGNIALPKLDVRPLRRLARAGGGEFAVLRSDNRDIAALNLGVVSSGGKTLADDDQRSIERWLDRGPWLLLLLLPLVALTFRRGGYALVALLAIGLAPRAQAGFWQDLWRTPDQQGAVVLEQGDPQAAAEQFNDPHWKATAHYRAGNYEQSAQQFQSIAGAEGRYNAGTSLARAGDIAGAIEALEAALAISPDHEDARFNLDLLRDLQEQNDNQGEGDQSGEGQQSQDSEGQDGEPGSGQSNADSAGQGDSQGEPSDQQSSARAGESADEEQRQIESLQQAMREAEAAAQNPQDPDGQVREQPVAMTEAERNAAEQQQALEQWLRRVEDDPGGLLRRKFRYQYQRRQTDQDGVRLWPDDRSEPW